MADRVRMKATSVFHNALITSHAKAPRADVHTVIEDDEFSTYEDHAQELERLGLAVRSKGEAAEPSEAAQRLRGSQTRAGGAVTSDRAVQG